MGTTNSLIQKDPEREWVAANNPEFNIEVGNVSLGAMELGMTDFSDSNNELGATLTLIKSGHDMVYTVTTTALHDLPVMTRQASLANVGGHPKRIKSFSLDSFQLDSSDCKIMNPYYTKNGAPITWDKEENLMAIACEDSGLLLMRTGDAHFVWTPDEKPTCTVKADVNRSIGLSEKVVCGLTLIMPYDGSPLDYANKHIPEVMKQLKAFEMSEQKKARDLKEEEPT
jgi:hypothetical protein